MRSKLFATPFFVAAAVAFFLLAGCAGGTRRADPPTPVGEMLVLTDKNVVIEWRGFNPRDRAPMNEVVRLYLVDLERNLSEGLRGCGLPMRLVSEDEIKTLSLGPQTYLLTLGASSVATVRPEPSPITLINVDVQLQHARSKTLVWTYLLDLDGNPKHSPLPAIKAMCHALVQDGLAPGTRS